MKHKTNDLLRSALKRCNTIRKAMGIPNLFDIKRIRWDLPPSANMRLLSRLMQGGPQLTNDVNSLLSTDGYVTKTGDAAIARYLLVQKGASLAANVAVYTSGTPLGITEEPVATTGNFAIRLLLNGPVGTCYMTSDASAAVAVGDILIPVSGGTVKTLTGTGNLVIVGQAVEACGNGATTLDAEFEAQPCLGYRTL
jgi:hypothetical protein